MAAQVVTVSSKGQIVIPAEIRKQWGIEAGQKLVFVDMGDHLSLVKAMDDPIHELAGIIKGGPSLTQQLVDERRRERAREEAELRRCEP